MYTVCVCIYRYICNAKCLGVRYICKYAGAGLYRYAMRQLMVPCLLVLDEALRQHYSLKYVFFMHICPNTSHQLQGDYMSTICKKASKLGLGKNEIIPVFLHTFYFTRDKHSSRKTCELDHSYRELALIQNSSFCVML